MRLLQDSSQTFVSGRLTNPGQVYVFLFQVFHEGKRIDKCCQHPQMLPVATIRKGDKQKKRFQLSTFPNCIVIIALKQLNSSKVHILFYLLTNKYEELETM